MRFSFKNILRIAGLGVLVALAVYIGGEKPQLRSMRNYMAGDIDGLTNRLHFTAIAVSSNAVAFSAAWPATNPPPDGIVDLYATTNLLEAWQFADSYAIPSGTNEFDFVYPYGNLSSNARFFSLGTRTDEDNDGLYDAYEYLVLNTDPENPDTDGDGLDDSYETGNGLNPSNPDSDGDGMPDGWELDNWLDPLTDDSGDDSDDDGMSNLEEYRCGTNPRAYDTDHDGLPDGWEAEHGLDPSSAAGDNGAGGDADGDGLSNADEYTIGTNPVLQDTDGDGLVDISETGFITASSNMTWIALPPNAVDITSLFAESGMVSVPLQSPVSMNGEIATNAVIDVNGMVYFPRAGSECDLYSRGWINLSVPLCTNALVLAPYNAYLCLSTNAPAPKITVAETEAYGQTAFVLQYENICPEYNASREHATNTVSFQVVVPASGDGAIHFLYKDISGEYMTGNDARIGLQPPGGLWSHVYSYYGYTCISGNGNPMFTDTLQGRLYDGLDIAFHHGTGTSPANADTDGDGLADGAEIAAGTSLFNADTDGDGLPDGWEYAHEDFDPLVDNLQDGNPDNDASADPDGDGATNLQEAQAGSNPSVADTDGDGIPDGAEIQQDTSPTDRADKIPTRWVPLTGNLSEGETNTLAISYFIPSGTVVYAAVFINSEEYPVWTGRQSEYNDILSWNIAMTGNEPLAGDSSVNPEDGEWHEAFQNDCGIPGFFPVVLKDGAFFAAGNEGAEISLELRAVNIGDGILPSSVIAGLFPVNVVQANMPQATGADGTTDGGLPCRRETIPTNGVAYITGEPAAPQLTARVRRLPWWVETSWSLSLVSERSAVRMDGIDDRAIAQTNMSGGRIFEISRLLQNEIVGGACTLSIGIRQAAMQYPFSIRGKNPLDATARAYITANVDAEFADIAWKIAKHESKAGSRVYNQFNPAGSMKEKPNKTSGANSWGWGMAQIDKGAGGTTTAEVYDWHANIASMNAKLRSSARTADRFIGYYRSAYSESPNWTEPPSTNINGHVVTGREWSIMTLYNGAGLVPYQTTPERGRRFQSPLQFDPANGTWIFHDNGINRDYIRDVLNDSLQNEVE